MPTASDNKRAVYAYFAAVEKEGLGALSRFATQDVRWWTAGAGELPIDTVIGTVAVINQALAAPMTLTVHDVIAEGDRVAAEVESRAPLKNGTVYNNLYHFKFIFHDGKIAEIKEYNDTKHAAEIWGPVLSPA